MNSTETVSCLMRPLDSVLQLADDVHLSEALRVLRTRLESIVESDPLVLISSDGIPVGIVAERDLLAALEPDYLRRSPSDGGYGEIDTELALVWDSLFSSSARDRLTASVATAMRDLGAPLAPQDRLTKAACLMIQRDLPLLWVQDEGQPVGIVLRKDVFIALTNRLFPGEPA